MISKLRLIIYITILYFTIQSTVLSEIIKKIEVNGNERISTETIIMFANVKIDQNIDENKLNEIVNNLYNTNFFKNVSAEIRLNILKLKVLELPLIENVTINGLKAKKIKEALNKNLKLKARSSFDEFLFSQEKENLNSILKGMGYYYAVVVGEKAKIKKITFIGNKVFKDSKLKSVIVSEEYKFWKFISGKKFLNQEFIEFDGPYLLNVIVEKEENVFPMIPTGSSVADIRLE